MPVHEYSAKWPQHYTESLTESSDRSNWFDVSVVIPVYYNEANLEPIMRLLSNDVIEKHPELKFEVIFIDDGSGDNSFRELTKLKAAYPSLIRIIKFSRNFGQASALQAGFVHARGNHVVAMSADGQDPPTLINKMLDAHYNENRDIVICVRKDRDESRYRRWTSGFFYRLIRKLSFPDIPLGGFDFVSLSRRALFHAFLETRETHPFFQGQILSTGFLPKEIPYTRQARVGGGRSRWTFSKKITYLIDGALSYSYLPIRAMSVSGVFFAFVGFLYAAVVLVGKLFGGIDIEGWAPLMMVILIMGGIQMMLLGIIGEYVWRGLAQARKRPPYIIESLID